MLGEKSGQSLVSLTIGRRGRKTRQGEGDDHEEKTGALAGPRFSSGNMQLPHRALHYFILKRDDDHCSQHKIILRREWVRNSACCKIKTADNSKGLYFGMMLRLYTETWEVKFNLKKQSLHNSRP